MDKAAAFDIVYNAIDIVNGLRSTSEQVAKAPETVLAGSDGALDSLALVTLILAIESRITSETGAGVSLLDSGFDEYEERLRTPKLIVDFIMEKLPV